MYRNRYDKLGETIKLIEFIDEELQAFEAGTTEDYTYERDVFIRELSQRVNVQFFAQKTGQKYD